MAECRHVGAIAGWTDKNGSHWECEDCQAAFGPIASLEAENAQLRAAISKIRHDAYSSLGTYDPWCQWTKDQMTEWCTPENCIWKRCEAIGER